MTASLLRLAVGTPTLDISMRKCNNRVFTMYMHRRVPFNRVLRMHPQVAHFDARFEELVLELPDLLKLRLLVFHKPVILVGTTTALAMRIAMKRFLPFVLYPIELEETARPEDRMEVDRQAPSLSTKKRKRGTQQSEESSTEGRARKRPAH